MKPVLYAHPFSSYSQKVLIALDENDIAFEFRMLGPDNPSAAEELAALWPMTRFPVLVDQGCTVMEASIIIEYLGLHYPGPVELVPRDLKAALEVRLMDRVFDNYIMTPMQKLVGNQLRPEADRDPHGVTEARKSLDLAYGWLDQVMARRHWAAGDRFTMADCAAAPSLFYADWAHEMDGRYAHLRGYRARLLARPSFARAVDAARKYRHFFPLGAPDRD